MPCIRLAMVSLILHRCALHWRKVQQIMVEKSLKIVQLKSWLLRKIIWEWKPLKESELHWVRFNNVKILLYLINSLMYFRHNQRWYRHQRNWSLGQRSVKTAQCSSPTCANETRLCRIRAHQRNPRNAKCTRSRLFDLLPHSRQQHLHGWIWE